MDLGQMGWIKAKTAMATTALIYQIFDRNSSMMVPHDNQEKVKWSVKVNAEFQQILRIESLVMMNKCRYLLKLKLILIWIPLNIFFVYMLSHLILL